MIGDTIVDTSCGSPDRENIYTTARAGCAETPIERLESELLRARDIYESTYIHQEAKNPLEPLTITNNKEDTRKEEIDKCLETTKDLSKEMELARKEMIEASRRAEDFLADLKNRPDEPTDERGLHGSPLVSPRNSKSAEPVSTDVKSLLQEIAVLKVHVKAAREEAAELRSALSTAQSTKSHTTSIQEKNNASTNASRAVPSEVVCAAQTASDEIQSHISSSVVVRHSDCRSSANEEEEEDEEDGMCGNQICAFGGLVVKIINGGKRETSLSILT